ncbi:IclR family transcriptional regulator [Limnobaculum zhutongyuii]|uniref:IclR family transcriptional regulator n=1 Tax=Limnobaculum zhutongyuii TaxID=2498113 RepID=A0A411WK48_9GAMM|nr:IclR family transcriptional regulator [Limnobaculum zhutongyuii]QBH96538.1 IclR family transcriptional regulator [Limnobaculum zhutongyuii]TQS90431.1 IclR family transcriptional regulator [Limnobaculum zhutongyuii]
MQEITTKTPAIDKTTRILKYVSTQGSVTFSQIHQTLDLAQSSTATLLNSLVAHGFLRQEKGRYYLGLTLFELGIRAIESFDIRDLAIAPMTFLRDSTGLACHLGVLDNTSAIYLAKIESPGAIVVRSWLGKRLSLHSSSLGKCLLAWLPEAEIDRLLPEESLEVKTKTTITTRSAFKAELATVRRQGWAFDNEEDYDGVSCISAPVFDRNNKVIAAISMSGVSFQVPEEKIPEFVELVKTAANMLSESIR